MQEIYSLIPLPEVDRLKKSAFQCPLNLTELMLDPGYRSEAGTGIFQ